MDMDPRDLLALAKRLLVNEKSPAGRRSTISRAYYAAYNVAVEFLLRVVKLPKVAATHVQVSNCLNNSKDATLVQMGRELIFLRKQRNDADYDLQKKQVEDEKTVLNWVDAADTIIKNIDGCKDQRLKSVMEAIKTYAVSVKIELR